MDPIMKNNPNITTCFIFLLALIIPTSCLKTNVDDVAYNPTFSVPIGSTKTIFSEIASGRYLYPAPSDSTRSDSIPVIYYDDSLYYSSISLDSTFYKIFNFDDIEDILDRATEIVFRINYTNHFPSEVSAQVYFGNKLEPAVDSLFTNGPYIADAASTDAEGKVISPNSNTVEIPFDKERIDHLLISNTITFHNDIKLVSNDSPKILKFYSDQSFEMQIGLRVTIYEEINIE